MRPGMAFGFGIGEEDFLGRSDSFAKVRRVPTIAIELIMC
jgi:hypothetical protein